MEQLPQIPRVIVTDCLLNKNKEVSSRNAGWVPRRRQRRVAICFLDMTLPVAFVARWCAGHKVEMTEGAYRVREDAPAPRIGVAAHRTP